MTVSYDLPTLLAHAQLPALPQSAVRLLELSQNADNGPPEFAAPIEADPGLTSQVLRFVNSSYFGFADEVTSVRLAITLVGVRTIKNFALWSAVFSLIPNPKCGALDLKTLWQDSLRRALLARELVKRISSSDAEEVFTAALLQDMAIPLLAKELPNEYAEMLANRAHGNVRLTDLEQQRFGWNHGQAAAIMAADWSLPSSFTRLLTEHANVGLWRGAYHGDAPLFAIGLSALLPSAIDEGWPNLEQFNEIFCASPGQSTEKLVELLGVVDKLFEEFAPVLQLQGAVQTLAELWETETATAPIA